MPISIRQATVQDLDVIVPLFDAYRGFYGRQSDPTCARAFLAERFAHHESIIFLAYDQSDAVGFTQLYPVFSSVSCTRKYLLNDLFVIPALRRAGAGRALLVAAADFARAQGAASLSLSTGVNNATAQHLYESLGWTRDESYYEYNLAL
ncbi:MAG TPA: GNAT family N-acetyltransferase [Rhodanobacteraceae bacterium]|jgi:GNAT superfamily N-acetyltransferase|nr:GNAT family N-acetyltransferase [Rhodanobacteraceae bacterium]